MRSMGKRADNYREKIRTWGTEHERMVTALHHGETQCIGNSRKLCPHPVQYRVTVGNYATDDQWVWSVCGPHAENLYQLLARRADPNVTTCPEP